jgi:carboxymethylenebutenolidase
MTTIKHVLAAFVVLTVSACTHAFAADKAALPPGEKEAKERLNTSPRHGEFVDIAVPDDKVPLKTYVVYPERKEKAPVVIIIHEIFGLSDWIRGVADQLAAEGFIAVAPDLISGMGPNGGGTDAVADRDGVVKLVRGLKPEDVVKKLNAVREYGMKLPAANGKTASIGFCWGGGTSFAYAVAQPGLNAAVVYYGTSPSDAAAFAKINAPVQGHYGGDDARVDATIPPAKKAMTDAGKKYDPHIYDGAGHGFLRQQDGKDGANMKAAEQAWPATIKFLKENCE